MTTINNNIIDSIIYLKYQKFLVEHPKEIIVKLDYFYNCVKIMTNLLIFANFRRLDTKEKKTSFVDFEVSPLSRLLGWKFSSIFNATVKTLIAVLPQKTLNDVSPWFYLLRCWLRIQLKLNNFYPYGF